MGNAEHIPLRIRDELAAVLRNGSLPTVERFRRTKPDTYARRLLYVDPAGLASPHQFTITEASGVWRA
jgi:hypothetical protein